MVDLLVVCQVREVCFGSLAFCGLTDRGLQKEIGRDEFTRAVANGVPWIAGKCGPEIGYVGPDWCDVAGIHHQLKQMPRVEELVAPLRSIGTELVFLDPRI